MFNQKIKIMKKTLLLGTALMVGVAGFAQNAATKAINPKYLQKKSIFAEGKIATETQPTTAAGIKVSKKGANSTMAGCTNQMSITTSYNCFGVGGGLNTSDQNCLSYNKDLNSLVWTQRGSKTWALNTTGKWYPSAFSGSLMVRPIVGKPIPLGVEESPPASASLEVWPNPCSNGTLHLRMSNNGTSSSGRNNIKISNLLGQTVFSSKYSEQLDLSSLGQGIYILHLSGPGGNNTVVKKIIITP